MYTNVYLFEINIPALTIQKNNRQLEILVQESILNTIRDSIPVETILRAYMDETIEEDVVEEIKEKEVKESEELKKLRQKLETPSKIIEEDKPIPILKNKEVLPEKLEDSDDDEIKILNLMMWIWLEIYIIKMTKF